MAVVHSIGLDNIHISQIAHLENRCVYMMEVNMQCADLHAVPELFETQSKHMRSCVHVHLHTSTVL